MMIIKAELTYVLNVGLHFVIDSFA